MTNIRISFEICQKLSKREFNVAETLTVLSNSINVFWSWGVSKIFNFNSTALLLYVQGHHHKGWVVVTLNWDDTYSYYLLNPDESIKKEKHDVYFTELQDSIDLDVEFIDEYR